MGRGKKPKREKNTIDFQESICFYEDSEGDFNVISEDEDLADATTYILQHKSKALKCTIVPKQFYEDLRNEQMGSDLNQSATWLSSTLNQFKAKAQKEKRARKQKSKEEDQFPASMMSKIDEIVRQRVESELERERVNNTARDIEMAASPSNGTLPLVDASMAASSVGQIFEPSMAVLISTDFMNIDVIEGREVSLEFTVENKSNTPWPFKPFVQNEKEKAVKQHVNTILQPGEQGVIRYVFRAPLQQD